MKIILKGSAFRLFRLAYLFSLTPFPLTSTCPPSQSGLAHLHRLHQAPHACWALLTLAPLPRRPSHPFPAETRKNGSFTNTQLSITSSVKLSLSCPVAMPWYPDV